jgi:hypothetical protein
MAVREYEDYARRMRGELNGATPPRRQQGVTDKDVDPDTLAPVIDWEHFVTEFLDWQQGEHLAMIGPTGAGKTTLALYLLGIRHYVTVFATKPQDKTLDALQMAGYKLMKEWKGYDPDIVPKRLLWPSAKKLYAARAQRQVFQQAFNNIYGQGGWCVFVDELWFIIHHLKLELEIRTYLMQARSLNISLAVCTQRPSRVPLEIYDQSTHLFFWRDADEANLKRIGGISWANAWHVQRLVAGLRDHEFLYVNTRTAQMCRVIPPPPPDN